MKLRSEKGGAGAGAQKTLKSDATSRRKLSGGKASLADTRVCFDAGIFARLSPGTRGRRIGRLSTLVSQIWGAKDAGGIDTCRSSNVGTSSETIGKSQTGEKFNRRRKKSREKQFCAKRWRYIATTRPQRPSSPLQLRMLRPAPKSTLKKGTDASVVVPNSLTQESRAQAEPPRRYASARVLTVVPSHSLSLTRAPKKRAPLNERSTYFRPALGP